LNMTHESLSSIKVQGILLGHEIGEWAGFRAGTLNLELLTGERLTLRFGKESKGVIPPICSSVVIEYTPGILPEIVTIELDTAKFIDVYENSGLHYETTLFFNRPKALVVISLVEVFGGISLAVFGLLMASEKPIAPFIFAAFAIPHIIIAFLLWDYAGR